MDETEAYVIKHVYFWTIWGLGIDVQNKKIAIKMSFIQVILLHLDAYDIIVYITTCCFIISSVAMGSDSSIHEWNLRFWLRRGEEGKEGGANARPTPSSNAH